MRELDKEASIGSLGYEALEGTIEIGWQDLEKALRLDGDKVWVLGLHLYRDHDFHYATAYVVDREEVPNFEALQDLARANDGIVPVREIEVDLANATILREPPKLSVILTAGHQIIDQGLELRVMEDLDE